MTTNDVFSLEGKTALIVGGAGAGIGAEIAAQFRARGADVIVGDLGAATGADHQYVELDVTSTDSVQAAVSEIVRNKGGIDILVNCAGIRHSAPIEESVDADWAKVFGVNAEGTYRVCREVGKVMLAGKGGSIINLASMSAQVVNIPQEQAIYNASKAAVLMLSKSLAVEWASRGVRVNTISPGYVATPMTEGSRNRPDRINVWLEHTPLNRIARVDEIAPAAVYLASDASSFITGTDLVIDGGYTAL